MRKQDTPGNNHELINRKNYKGLQPHGTIQETIKVHTRQGELKTGIVKHVAFARCIERQCQGRKLLFLLC